MQTILLVDAPGGDSAVLASALRVEGFHVVHAANASAARDVVAGGDVAVALIDLMMRGEGAPNGLELARELKGVQPAMRVLLTSAYHLSERQLERVDCGVSGFVPKPYDVGEVVSFIRQKASGPPSSRRLWHAEAAGLPPVPNAAGSTRRR